MPETWDPTIYRERAAAWRNKAAALSEDHDEQAVCVVIAEGYETLAALIEERKGQRLMTHAP